MKYLNWGSLRDQVDSIHLGPDELGDGVLTDCVVLLTDVVNVERWADLLGRPAVAIYMTNGRCVSCRGPNQGEVWQFFTGTDLNQEEKSET